MICSSYDLLGGEETPLLCRESASGTIAMEYGPPADGRRVFGTRQMVNNLATDQVMATLSGLIFLPRVTTCHPRFSLPAISRSIEFLVRVTHLPNQQFNRGFLDTVIRVILSFPPFSWLPSQCETASALLLEEWHSSIVCNIPCLPSLLSQARVCPV